MQDGVARRTVDGGKESWRGSSRWILGGLLMDERGRWTCTQKASLRALGEVLKSLRTGSSGCRWLGEKRLRVVRCAAKAVGRKDVWACARVRLFTVVWVRGRVREEHNEPYVSRSRHASCCSR
jgi:hypothetical protein